MNINRVFYERKTNAYGYMNINIKLPLGIYTVTAEYNGLKDSNTINVSSILKTKDLSMGFKERLGLKRNYWMVSRPHVNPDVTFNINGVFYKNATDS